MVSLRRALALVVIGLLASACTSTNVVGTTAAGQDLLAFEEVPMATPDPAALPTPAPPTPEPTPTSAPVYQVVTVVPASTPKPGPTPTPVPRVADIFPVGGCYQQPGYRAGEPVSCAGPHFAEVVATGVFNTDADAPLVEEREALRVIGTPCQDALVSAGFKDFSNVGTHATWASPSDWAAGDRSWSCWAVFDQPVSQTVAQIGSIQTAEWNAQRTIAEEQFRENERQRVAASQPQIGDCIVAYQRASCDGSHDGIVFAIGSMPSASGGYPGDALINETINEFCGNEARALDLSGSYYGIYPQQWEWDEFGVRTFSCVKG